MQIEYTSLERYKSLQQAVKSVCRERKYLASTTGYTDEQTLEFVKRIIENNHAQFLAVVDDQVVGWCDIIPGEQEVHRHVGALGIGVLKDYRGKGIGKKLLKKTIGYAFDSGLERIELNVYASNQNALALYEKIGFAREGIKRKAKKLDGEYEDVIIMGLLSEQWQY